MTGNPFASLAEPDDALVNAVMMTESGGRPDAVSPKGAMGPMQLMPGTARDLGVDPTNPFANIEGGSRYLDQMMKKYGDQETALMAYNWGPGNVDRWVAGGRKGPVPAETRTYVQRVLSRLNPVGTAPAAEPENPFAALADAGNPFDAFDGSGGNPFDQFEPPPDPGIGGSFIQGARAGFRGLGEQASTLAGLATGTPAAAPGVDDFDAKYADVPFYRKVLDPNWLAHFIPQTVVGSAPFMAGAGAGAMAGAPLGPIGSLIGAMIGGGTAGGFQALADAYNEALRAKKGHDEAVDYAMKQGAVNAGMSAATIPLGLWGVAKGPISYVLKQMGAQTAGAAATQGAANVIAKAEDVDPNRDVTAGMPEAVFGAGLFQAPVTAKVMRAHHLAGKRVGEEPGAPAPGAEAPEPGTRVVLGLEEEVADPETGQTTKTATPADVTVQGYDPETGLVTLTRDADGVQLGPMPLEDFQALMRPEAPGPIPEAAPVDRGDGLTEQDAVARDAALDVARERGFAEDLEGGQMPKAIPVEEAPVGEVPFAPGLPEETGKRPFMTRDPRPTTPEFPGMEDAEVRMAYEMDVAEEADRVSPRASTGKAPPRDILQFIADEGGIWDTDGELRNADLHLYQPPGQKKLIVGEGRDQQDSLTGMSRLRSDRQPENVLQAVKEAGYLWEDADTNDLNEAMRATRAGKREFSKFDIGDVLARDEAADAKAERSAQLRERAAELGIDPTGFNDRDLRRQVREYEDAEMGESPVRERAPKVVEAATARKTGERPTDREIEYFKALTGADVDWTRLNKYDVSTAEDSLQSQTAAARTDASRKYWERQREIADYVLYGEEPKAGAKTLRAEATREPDIAKTPEGAYALKDTDGEPLGAYPSKKRAEEAAVDRRQTNDAVEGMTLRQAAEQEAAAKTATEGRQDKPPPPKTVERATELLPDPPAAKVRMKDLGAAEAKGIFPRTLAMQDRPFAKLFKPVQRRTEDQTRNYRDFFWQVKPLGALTKPSRDQVYKAAVIARLANRNIVPTGARLVIKNGDRAVTDPDTGKTWLSPGETIKLTKEETEAYFAMKSAMQTVWRRHTDAVVRKLGYDGDMDALRKAAASKSEAARTKFLEEAAKPETAKTALDAATGLLDQEKAGYIPFQRRGDVMITVMPKGGKDASFSADPLGGTLKPLESILVDSGTLRKSMFGRKFEPGDYGKAVAAKVKELRQRYKDTGDVLEPRYISEMRPDELPLNALERLVSGIAHKNPDLRDALMNGFLGDVMSSAKAGFRKQSDDLAGFSTDFDRMLTEYLHHTARVLPMIEHRNTIDKAKERLLGARDSKGKAIPPEGSRTVRDYATKWLKSVDDPGGDFPALRKAGFLWWLWASPASALVNLTQTPLVTIPVLAKWGGFARTMLEANKVAAQILRPDKMMFGKKNWGTEDAKIVLLVDNLNMAEHEKAVLRKWERNGSLQAQVTSEMTGNNIGKSPAFRPMAKMAQKSYESGASLFGAAEVTNRVIAGITAYRLARQPENLAKAKKLYKDNQLFQEMFGDKVTPENLGEWAILETQFQGGDINTPEIMRGIGAPLTQFKKFTANYLSLLNRQFRHEGAAGKVASTMMLASLVAAAGLKGLPFAQDIADAVDWATETVTSINPHVEMTVRNWLRDGLEGVGGERWGDIASEMLMNGPSRHLTGMDLGARFGQGDIVPGNAMDLFGPLAGAISQGADAAKLYKSGQNYQATERILPKAIGNVAGALGYQEQGVTTAAGNRVMMPSEFEGADVAKKAMGFQPAELARRYEDIFDLSKVDADARRATAGFYRRLANSVALAQDADKAGDKRGAERFMERFQADLDKYLKNIEDPHRPDYIKFKLNRESLKREIANAMDWSRRFTKGSPRQAKPKIMEMMERMGRSVGADLAPLAEDGGED